MRGLLTISLLVIAGFAANAQAMPQVEQQILGHLKHIQYWRFEYSPEDTVFKVKVSQEDSLVVANKMLETYLLDICTKQPATLRAVFQLPENSDMKIVSSDDGKLRIYSWDTHQSTDEHIYATIYQFETARGIKATSNVQPSETNGKCYQKIYAIGNSYIAVSSDMTAENNVTKALLGLVISGDKLSLKDLFANDSKVQSTISYTYNYSSNYDFKKMKEEYDIRFEKQRLLIPEVADYKMTGKYLVYNFDGSQFVLDKNAK